MRPRSLVLLAVLALAGCAAPAPDAGTATQEAPPGGDAVLMPCVEHAGDFPVDEAEAAALLPDGLRPRRAAPNAPPLVEVVAVECAGDLPGRALFAWMLVEPPEDLRADGVAGFLYVFAAVAQSEAVAGALQAAGVPAVVGEVALSTRESPATVVGSATATTEGWSVAIDTLVPKRLQQRTHPVFRAFVANATGVTHAVDVDGGSHPHHDPGQASLRATGAAPFPVPRAPGVGVHGFEGHLGFTLVPPDRLAAPPGEGAEPAPTRS